MAKVRSQHIHDDISLSILSKLSIKSLKRFESVCKSWSQLFDNPNFMTLYQKFFLSKDHPYYTDKSLLLHQTNSIEGGNCYDRKFDLYSISDERLENRVKLNWWPKVPLPRLPNSDDSGFHVLGSINGTLCLMCTFERNFVLWNPSTKQFNLIPLSPVESHYGNYSIFHSDRVFGYDCVGDDFNFLHSLRININDTFSMYEIRIWEIYSLRRNSWKKLELDTEFLPAHIDVQLYIEGLSHWLVRNKEHNRKPYLVSFDWSNEVFLNPTPLPSYVDVLHNGSMQNQLMLLNGSIALISLFQETSTFHILILGELGVEESWTKIFMVGPLSWCLWPIGVAKKGGMLFGREDPQQEGPSEVRLVWFDLNTQMAEDLGIIEDSSLFMILFHQENLITV